MPPLGDVGGRAPAFVLGLADYPWNTYGVCDVKTEGVVRFQESKVSVKREYQRAEKLMLEV
jgi:hypothetical protein